MIPLRLLRSPAWWRAHRSELPTWYDALLGALCVAIVAMAIWEYSTYELRREAQWVSDSAGRFKACLEGRRTLGSIEEHGVTWDVTCQEVLKRRTP